MPPPAADPVRERAARMPIIVTALLEPVVMARLEALRRRWYPPTRNQVPAHVSLFHQLPGSEFDAAKRRMKQLCGSLAPLPVTVAAVRSLGHGTALRLVSPELVGLRAELADGWAGLLIAQDRSGFDPHVTIQNKATPAEARACLAEVGAGFAAFETRVVALALWRYLDGPWQHLGDIALRGR